MIQINAQKGRQPSVRKIKIVTHTSEEEEKPDSLNKGWQAV